MNNNLTVVFSSHFIDDENEKFIDRLKKTSGLKNIEIICYKNYGEFSLAELYNKAFLEAKNDIILFCHNDIEIETLNWGKILLNNFNENQEYGILGLAGTTDLINGCWWSDQSKMVGIVNHSKDGKKWSSMYSNDFKDQIIDVVALDGVFFAVDRKKIKKQFNETFKGFHFYDIPFMVDNFLANVNIGVMFNIRVTHFSVGQINKEWESNKLQFEKEYNGLFPLKKEVSELFYDDDDVNFKTSNLPKVSVIIPTKSKIDILFNCINSFREYDNYPNYEIIIADTGSTEDELGDIEEFIKDFDNVKLIKYNYYNFAKINNDVIKNHLSENTELLLFCNNDIELINNALSRLVRTYLKNKNTVGTIGARLHYPNNLIQHSGIIFIYNPKFKNLGVTHFGLNSYYRYVDKELKNVPGSTGAFLMIKKDLFIDVGMFNEEYCECFEDVELNLQCILHKKENIFVGDAVCYHYESLSRNDNDDKNERIMIDFNNRLVPYINKNIDIFKKYFSI